MASNANSSPDPDAAARRRSGRVVKAPDRLAPEPSQKRKRDGADEEDDMEDDVPELDEDESDVPDPESDEEPTPARKSRKASQSKRAKKPASKKPKINGTQPAAVKRTMTLPRMPKKPVRLDTEGKGNSLYSTAPRCLADQMLTWRSGNLWLRRDLGYSRPAMAPEVSKRRGPGDARAHKLCPIMRWMQRGGDRR